MTQYTQDDLQKLTQWDTPTICNGLEIICPERRAYGFTTEPLVCLDPSLPSVIGHARTATIRAAVPSTGNESDDKTLRLNYYEYIAKGRNTSSQSDNNGPSIVVIEDLDSTPGFGAFWGEVNTNIHKGLGAMGCVTNGSMRDLPDAAPGFQLLAGQVGPSHAYVHLVDFGNTVTVNNMTVSDGDIIHMDQHGAVVVPPEAVTQLPGAIELITRREAVIISAAQSPDFSFEVLRESLSSAAEIH